uniref:Chromosome 17 open reading frame 67 n=1 Tax=Calidris pygmaea TaxID=425635 RepID=A0A8C3J161_9CHAR
RGTLPLIQWCELISAFLSLDTSPILPEKDAKQILRTRREDRPRKAGFPDEPMREYMLYLQRLEQRSEEQFLEHWLNPHCLPHCNRDLVHPI